MHKTKMSNEKHTQSEPSGFSLVELLVVVAILAILAAIAIPLFLNQRSKAAQGAVQSDARNLATNLNTLFTNLPLSADPNVALNGSAAPNATLSGSGTVAVGGETLNVNLSPDVTITKTGNANPTDGAGLKLTHAGVENWACAIPLPSSVAYAQTVTFQPACGMVVGEAGNLLSFNAAAFVDGDLDGWSQTTTTGGGNGTTASEVSSELVKCGNWSMKGTVVAESGTTRTWRSTYPERLTTPVTPGVEYTARIDAITTPESLATGWPGWARVYVTYRDAGDAIVASNVVGTYINLSSSAWETISLTFTPPAGAAYVAMAMQSVGNPTPAGATVYFDCAGIWEGNNTEWSQPGMVRVEP